MNLHYDELLLNIADIFAHAILMGYGCGHGRSREELRKVFSLALKHGKWEVGT